MTNTELIAYLQTQKPSAEAEVSVVFCDTLEGDSIHVFDTVLKNLIIVKDVECDDNGKIIKVTNPHVVAYVVAEDLCFYNDL